MKAGAKVTLGMLAFALIAGVIVYIASDHEAHEHSGSTAGIPPRSHQANSGANSADSRDRTYKFINDRAGQSIVINPETLRGYLAGKKWSPRACAAVFFSTDDQGLRDQILESLKNSDIQIYSIVQMASPASVDEKLAAAENLVKEHPEDAFSWLALFSASQGSGAGTDGLLDQAASCESFGEILKLLSSDWQAVRISAGKDAVSRAFADRHDPFKGLILKVARDSVLSEDGKPPEPPSGVQLEGRGKLIASLADGYRNNVSISRYLDMLQLQQLALSKLDRGSLTSSGQSVDDISSKLSERTREIEDKRRRAGMILTESDVDLNKEYYTVAVKNGELAAIEWLLSEKFSK